MLLLLLLICFYIWELFHSLGEKVVSLNHHMPSGGAFEYVSCPHYFAEIVMYCSACFILNGSSYTWWLVCLWTVTNQIFTGLISHRWYQEKFKDYPSNRKAVIPFLLWSVIHKYVYLFIIKWWKMFYIFVIKLFIHYLYFILVKCSNNCRL